MKHSLLTFFLIPLTFLLFGQQLPYVGPDQVFIFPNVTNQFINSTNINWALDAEESYSFAESKKIEDVNIFNYLFARALSGQLKTYVLWQGRFEGFENSIYSEYDKFPNKALTNDDASFMLKDSLKTIKFHEIFYLDNYSLNCKIISAAPMTNFVASGASLGLQEIFFCCKNTNDTISVVNNKNLVHLKTIERILNFDSVSNSKIVKQTYGMNLIESIWCGASKNFIKLIDTKTNRAIAARDVMNYSYLDSVKNPIYDNKGKVVGHTMIAGQSTFPHKLSNSIQFTQNFYYDYKQNIFISTISNCSLFVYNWNDKNYTLTLEKRFKIL